MKQIVMKLERAFCPICYSDIPAHFQLDDISQIKCRRCGRFFIYNDALDIYRDHNGKLGPIGSTERAHLSSFLREENTNYMLTKTLIENPKMDRLGEIFLRKGIPDFKGKAFRLLIEFSKNLSPGQPLTDWFNELERYMAACWAESQFELATLIEALKDEKYIDGGIYPDNVGFEQSNIIKFRPIRITARGYGKIDALKRTGPRKKQCFVAMWFSDETSNVFINGIKPAVEDAGFNPLRIDYKNHNNKIDDEIINEIRNSSIMVADFTGHRGGVYFEVGFAMGLSRAVIFTCCDEEIDKLHFDIRQYNCLPWSKGPLHSFKRKLRERIKGVVADGMD